MHTCWHSCTVAFNCFGLRTVSAIVGDSQFFTLPTTDGFFLLCFHRCQAYDLHDSSRVTCVIGLHACLSVDVEVYSVLKISDWDGLGCIAKRTYDTWWP
jgi:hypothetical protein